MKILALRGENIASLAAPFEIDFTAGALADTGLFAICGPTGAGKSSILDAICLALFDATPRTQNDPSRVEVGHPDTPKEQRVASDDPRALLTRGSVSGFAEVDFRGKDGQRYRARWSVRRARKKVTGKLQPQTMSFVNLDRDLDLTDKKTLTKAAIQDRLGLDFGQFRRSVLLAQGEFAAFIQAKPKERGALLEQLTGTEIYARIAKATFHRAKAERIALADLKHQASHRPPLADEDRRELDKALAALEQREQNQQKVRKSLETQVAWWQRTTELEHSLSTASQQLGQARVEFASLLPDETAPPEAKDDGGVALLSWVEQQRPRLRKASGLDAAIESTRRGLRQLKENVARIEANATRERSQVTGLNETVRKLEQRQNTLDRWRSERMHLGRLAEQWELAHRELSRWYTAEDRLKTLQARTQLLATELSPKARERLLADEAVLAERAQQVELQQRRCHALEAEIDAMHLSQHSDERAHLEQVHRGLLQRDQIEQRQIELQTELKTWRAEGTAQQAAAATAQNQLTAERERLGEAQSTLERLRASLDLAGHRDELREGQPCPLCGSEQHPYGQSSPQFATLVGEQVERVEHLRQNCEASLARRSRAKQAEESAGERLRSLERESKKLDHDRAQIENIWQEHGGNPLTAIRDLPAPEQRPACEARMKALTQLLNQGDRLRDALLKARRQLELTTSEQRAAQAKQLASERALKDLEHEAERLAEKLHLGQAQRDEAQALLQPILGDDDWAAKVREQGQDYIVARESEIATWRQRAAELKRCQEDLPLTRTKLTAAQSAEALAVEQFQQVTEQYAERELHLTGQTTQRAELFAGQATDLIDLRLREIERNLAVHRERGSKLAAHLGHNAAELPLVALEQQLAEHGQQAQELKLELDELKAKLALDNEALRISSELAPKIREQQQYSELWQDLAKLIGEADGGRFRNYAQGLTLRIVLVHANFQLRQLRPRYELAPVPGHDLDLQVIDHDMGDEVRSLSSLSGGESFLVSLAMALGLSHSGGRASEVESLFIDEGFGTLDGDTLEVAIAALDALQAEGRSIGVISHVEGLAERLGARIELEPVGGGRSRVHIVEG